MIFYTWAVMNGFVYLLINPSFPDVLKIGKTSRDVEKRVQELSSATGVPTPFILVYSIYVNDCDLVEKSIHAELEQMNLRNTKNREFFNLDIPQAIHLLQRYQQNFAVSTATKKNRSTVTPSSSHADNSIELFYQKNGNIDLKAKYLLDQAAQEYRENKTLTHLKKAFKFNSIEAGLKLIQHPYFLELKNLSLCLDITLETYEMIKTFPSSDPYYWSIYKTYFAETHYLLINAISDADYLSELNVCDKLILEYKHRFQRYLNQCFFPSLQYLVAQPHVSSQSIKRVFQYFDAKFAQQQIKQLNATPLASLPNEHIMQSCYQFLRINILVHFSNFMAVHLLSRNYVAQILGDNFADKVQLMAQFYALLETEPTHALYKIAPKKLYICQQFLQHYGFELLKHPEPVPQEFDSTRNSAPDYARVEPTAVNAKMHFWKKIFTAKAESPL